MVLKITGRREGLNGENTHYRLSDGRIVTRAEAISIQKRGLLRDYHIYERNNVEYLRDNPDNVPKDNIDNQPLI